MDYQKDFSTSSPNLFPLFPCCEILMVLETLNSPSQQDFMNRMQQLAPGSQEQWAIVMAPSDVTLLVKNQLDTRSWLNSGLLSAAAPIQVGNTVSPGRSLLVGRKKSRKASNFSPSPSSKKYKASGAFSGESSKNFGDALAVCGFDLMKEEQEIYPAPSLGIHDSIETEWIVQEVEDRLFLDKIPLRLKLEQIMQKYGLKSTGDDVELCLSLCTKHFLTRLMANIIKMSNQSYGKEKPRPNIIVTSDVYQQIMLLNQKSLDELEKKQVQPGIVANLDEATKGADGKMPIKENMDIDTTNYAIRAALGDDDMLFRWQLRGLQSRQKNEQVLNVVAVLQPRKAGDPKLSASSSSRNNQKAEKNGQSVAYTGPVAAVEVGAPDVGPDSTTARAISAKDVIAVLEREFQMSKSSLLYRLFEKQNVQKDALSR